MNPIDRIKIKYLFLFLMSSYAFGAENVWSIAPEKAAYKNQKRTPKKIVKKKHRKKK